MAGVRTSKASLYMATWVCSPVRLKSSSMNSSVTSAKYSWPRSEQKDEIQDSGVPDDVDMLGVLVPPRLDLDIDIVFDGGGFVYTPPT